MSEPYSGPVTDTHEFVQYGAPYANDDICAVCPFPKAAHIAHNNLVVSEVNPALKVQVKDGGTEKTSFQTGAQREIVAGKGRWDLIPFDIIWDLARHFEAGANKYSAHNWEKGLPLSTFFNSSMDHKVDSYMLGLDDEDHPTADIWNAVCYSWTLKMIQAGRRPCSLDDRPIPHDKKGHVRCMEG